MSREGRPTVPLAEQQPQAAPSHSRLPRLAAAGAIVAAVAGVYELGKSNSGTVHNAAAATGNVPALVGSESQANSNCNNLELANSAADSSRYYPDAFLPNQQVTDAEGAKQYVFNLFGDKGPLAGQADKYSIAALMATVVDPSHQGGIENTNYDYITHFNYDLGRENGPNGKEQAIADCNKLVGTLVQDVGYNADWADAGETITEFAATRDQNTNDINGAVMNRGVTKVRLQGIEFKLRPTSKDQNGYLSVLVSTNSEGVWNGNLYIKGLSLQQFAGKSNVNQGHQPHERGKHQTRSQGASGVIVSRSSTGQLVIKSAGGGTSSGTFGNSKQRGESNKNGSVTETGPGSNKGNGGPQGHRPGPQQSFGGAPTTTTTGERTPSAPPTITQTQTQTSVETQTPPPPQTTTTTSTPPPPVTTTTTTTSTETKGQNTNQLP